MLSESRGDPNPLEFFGQFLALVPDLAVIATPDGCLSAVNPAFAQTLSCAANQEMSLAGFVHPDDVALTVRWLATGEAGGFVNRCRRADGSWKYIDWRLTPLSDGSAVLLTGRVVPDRMQPLPDCTDRQLSTVYDCVSDALFLLSVEGPDRYRFLTVNHAFLYLTGLSDFQVRGRYLHEVVPSLSRAAVIEHYRQAILSRSNVRWEETSNYPAGIKCGEVSITPVFDEHGKCTHVVGTVRDLTERNRSNQERAHLEDQLLQAQKMESIGRLAGGVAHDFNNLLTVINGSTELLKRGMSPGDPRMRLVKAIAAAGEQAALLTQQLLAFSRQQVIEPRIVDLNRVVKHAENMLNRLMGEDIALFCDLSPDACRVLADPVQVHQVLLNLGANARDAMPHGGSLVVETSVTSIGPGAHRRNPESREGRFVLMLVQDTGIGMDELTRKNIFEPFFTTKEPGKGTGLGLATVYGVVHQLNGWIDVDSAPGAGTVFRIYMPFQEEECAAEPNSAILPVPENRSETILLVEDQEEVRGFAKSALTSSGYRVIDAANGNEAIEASARHKGVIDMVVTDVIMPGMNGRELADRLKIDRPAMKILFMSGYTAEVMVQRGVDGNIAGFLPKPFTAISLAARVHETLTGSAGATAVMTA